jgi:hypothetical protein
VFSAGPVKVPDGPELFVGVGFGVVGAVVGFLVGAVLEGAVVGVVLVCVVAGAVGVGAVVGVDDAAVAVGFAVLDGDALADGDAVAVGDVVGGADTDSPAGVLGSATGVTPGTCVLNEKSAARPATVPPRVKTARRIQPPEGGVAPGESGRRIDG